VRDFHFRWFGEPSTEKGKVRVLRSSTVLFAVLLILVALGTAWIKAHNPSLRIIPIILGIFGYTYGSLLGVFLVGLFTQSRGSDRGNGIAMICGFLAVAYLSGLDKEFPWRIMFGTIITAAVALCFRSDRVKKHEIK
jgi:solute:Na+ symporter, SSS family